MTPPEALQAPAMGPSSPYGSGTLMGGSGVDGYELVRSCEHFIHTSKPPPARQPRGLLGGNFPIFRPLVGLPTGSVASGPSARTTHR